MASKTVCKIEGCGKPVLTHSLQLCCAHYTRLMRNGDPEVTRRPKNGAARAKIDEFKIAAQSTDDCLLWPFAKLPAGYGKIGSQLVHRVICEEVHGAPPTPEHHAAHRCGETSCGNWRHLYWATPVQNQADRVTHGTSNRGTRQWRAQLDEHKVREIRRMAAQGMKHNDIAAAFGVSRLTATKAINRYTWAWVE